MTEQFDLRIGKHGEYAPLICAACGEKVAGRHNTSVALGDGYYFQVLNKTRADKSKIKQELVGLLPTKRTPSRRTEVKPDDE